jgi:hypothetical protein
VTRAHQFFRKVWRFNALVILLAGVLGIAVLAFTAVLALNAMFRERHVTAVVNTDGQQQVQEVLSLGHAAQIIGHPWLLVAVESDQTYDQRYFSKSSSAARNYGFVAAAGPPRWLYPHNRFLIVAASQLPGVEYAQSEKPTAVVSFEVVRADTDGDERLTPSDLSSVVFATPDGAQSKTVLEKVRRVVSQEMIGEDVVILYEGASGHGKAVVSSTDFSRVTDEPFELPKAAGS